MEGADVHAMEESEEAVIGVNVCVLFYNNHK